MDATVRYSILGTVRVLRGDTELETGPTEEAGPALPAVASRARPPHGQRGRGHPLGRRTPRPAPSTSSTATSEHCAERWSPSCAAGRTREHLVRAADGYRLLVDTSTSDLLHFRDLRAQAQLAVKGGDPAQGAQDFIEALRLWRGPVVAAGTSVSQHPVFTSVGHEFVATAKEAADVVLTAAPALTEEILTVLRRAVDCHPFDEAIHSRIIAALAATGRQAEALQQFENIRRTLADELEVEPGPGLRAAQQHLLRRKVSPQKDRPAQPQAQAQTASQTSPTARGLRTVRRTPEGAAPVPGTPAPGGRKPAPHDDRGHLRNGRDRQDDPGRALGPPGLRPFSRRTDLHRSTGLPRLPTTPRTRARPCAEVLDALGINHDRTHTSATALGSAYRAALTGRRLLIVLDDARDCEQARPLLPATPGCLAIVTSRRRLDGLTVTDNARVITLDPMTRQEGLELLDRRLGADRIRAEHSAAEEIVELCGGLPLTLAVAGTRALVQPRFPPGLPRHPSAGQPGQPHRPVQPRRPHGRPQRLLPHLRSPEQQRRNPVPAPQPPPLARHHGAGRRQPDRHRPVHNT